MYVCRDVQKAIAGQPAAPSGSVPQYQQGKEYWGRGGCGLMLCLCVHRSEPASR